MNIYKHIKVAEEMGLPKSFAIRARQRYLTEQKRDLDLNIYALGTWLDGDVDIDYEYAYLRSISELTSKGTIARELRTLKKMSRAKTQEITDDMIDTAKNYPVDKLVDFKRGKAKAFCHEDKNPSMFHATRNNMAACPVCDKYFNAIGVLMERDGMDFKTAVKQLQ